MLLALGAGGPELVAAAEGTDSRVVSPGSDPARPWSTTAPESRRSREGSDGLKRIFFPPDPPPLDASIQAGRRVGGPFEAPWELATVVEEPFYAPLSTALVDLGDALRERYRPRVVAYIEVRDPMLEQLRDLLIELQGADAATRLARLEELGRIQTPRLRLLEAEAEALRRELARQSSWYAYREWRVGRGSFRDTTPEQRILLFQLVRAAASYQDGLAPAQRRLLREAAALLQDEIFAEREPPVEGAPVVEFFSPEMARVILPAAAAEQAEAFRREKAALRRELVSALMSSEHMLLGYTRRRAFEELAQAHAPRLAALENLAEDLRRQLASSGVQPRRPQPLVLPPDLEADIDYFLREKTRVQRAYDRRADALIMQMQASKPQGDPEATQNWYKEVADRSRAVAEQFERQHDAKLTELSDLLGEIFPRLIEVIGSVADLPIGLKPDSFLLEFMRAHREAWAYFEYEIAVYEPGLSPEQRRLLMGGAVRRLELPLPPAERQPVAAPGTFRVR